VTTRLDESYRPASVNRLVTVIVRTARQLGEEIVFEASGERLWKRLQDSLTGLMIGLLQIGALRDTASPFEVVCDRRTMTQSDIDNGRVIARVEFEAAIPIERITVLLAMSDGGQISLLNSALVTQEVA
jgi:phage tail sheath protein FI